MCVVVGCWKEWSTSICTYECMCTYICVKARMNVRVVFKKYDIYILKKNYDYFSDFAKLSPNVKIFILMLKLLPLYCRYHFRLLLTSSDVFLTNLPTLHCKFENLCSNIITLRCHSFHMSQKLHQTLWMVLRL